MDKKISNKQLGIYFGVAFGGAWAVQVLASYVANWGNPGGNVMLFQLLLMGCMYMPFLATLIARIPLKGMGFIPHLKGKVRYLFVAMWLPFVLDVLGAALYFLIFPDRFDPTLALCQEGLGAEGMAALSAQGVSIWGYVMITTIQALTIVPFFNGLVALGEEVGWRGALYPALKERLGVTKGRIVGGLCWGVWHFPVMILAGYEYGKNYMGAPILGMIAFCIFTVSSGILNDWIYEKTGTIWMPAVFHGATNALTIFVYLSKPEYADQLILGPAAIGLIGVIPSVAMAVWVCMKKKTAGN